MAHFAEIDENNFVIRVVVVDNNELLNNGVESEAKGIQFCKNLYGLDTNWVQASYNASIRKNYPGAGFIYDTVRDAFLSPQPFPSWTLNEDTCKWEAPIPHPSEGNYMWDEDTVSWVAVT